MLNSKGQEILLSASVIFSLSSVQHFLAVAIGVFTLVHIIMKVVNDFPQSKANWDKISKTNKIVITSIGVLIIALVLTIIFFFG